MEGLAATIDGVDFKILKGEVLRPAQSEPRIYFYQHSNNHLWAGDEIPELRSLVILWDCDIKGRGLRLYLVCPRDKAGNWVWRILIPPPAEWMAVEGATPDASGDLGGGDLDIEKSEPDEKKNGKN